MKLEVYNENLSEAEEPVRLRLMNGNDGVIHLRAVSANGEDLPQGTLLTFYPNGDVRRNWFVNSKLGFNLDSDRRLVIE